MAKSNDLFKISVYNTLKKYNKESPFDYLICLNRCDNINKINLINNNIFEEDFKFKHDYDNFKIPFTDINFNGENIHYNLMYYDKINYMPKIIYGGNCNNCKNFTLNYVVTPNCKCLKCNNTFIGYNDYNSILSNPLKAIKYNIINTTFTSTSEHTLTLEEYVRNVCEYLLNIPNLEVYVLLPNKNIIEYNSTLPCSTWTDAYLLIKYIPKNISRFEPIFEKILKEYYTQNLTKTITSIYKNHWFLGTDISQVKPSKTFWQNDDKYWSHELLKDQKQQITPIVYNIDPIIIKYKAKIEEQEKYIEELKEKSQKQIDDFKNKFNKDLENQIDELRKSYSEQITTIQKTFENKIEEQEETIIKIQNTKTINETLTDNTKQIKLESENKELVAQNELLITQFNGIKKKLNEHIEKVQEQSDEITTLKAKLLKQDNIIKKLTAY